MPRIGPVSHLFGNLNNAEALRESSLANRFFVGVGVGPDGDALGLRRVRLAIRQALVTMEEPSGLVLRVHERRQAAIIQRCDLDGAPHKQVAADFGISMRHLYRELNAARTTFTKRLHAVVVPEETNASSTIDLFELQLQRVRTLKHVGNFELALRSAQALLNAVEDDRKCDVLTVLAEVYAESCNVAALVALEQDVLRMARERFPVSREAIVARLRSLRGRALFLQGAADRSTAICRPETFLGANMFVSSRERAIWAISLLESAAFHSFIGHYNVSVPQIQLARDLTGENKDAWEPALRFRMLLGLTDLNLRSGSFAEGKSNLKRAYSVAVEHGLISSAFDATLDLATAEMLDGNANVALRIAREAVQALRDAPIAAKAWYIFLAAQIEASCRNAGQALVLLEQVRAAGDDADVMRTCLARAMEAECYAMQRRYTPAARGAADAVRGFRKSGMQRGLGYSLRVAAEVEAAMGNIAATREYILESVELLERFGHPLSLAKALELSGRTTGSRSHARRAKELLAAQ